MPGKKLCAMQLSVATVLLLLCVSGAGAAEGEFFLALLAQGAEPVPEYDAPHGNPLPGASDNYAKVLSLREAVLLAHFSDACQNESTMPPAEEIKSILMEREGAMLCCMVNDRADA